MKALLLLLLPLIIFNLDLSNYSINSFLDYLQETGLYEVIRNVKMLLGDDVAVEFCKEFVKSNDCKTVVIIYMSNDLAPQKDDDNYANSYHLKFEEFEDEKESWNENENKNENENESIIENEEMRLIQLVKQDDNFKILNKFYTKRQILFKSHKVLKSKELFSPN